MEETSEELPNFSIDIDLLGLDPTSNKNKTEKKTPKLGICQNQNNQGRKKSKCDKYFLNETTN